MKYRVEKVDAATNKDDILWLWYRNFSLSAPEERFSWMYLQNPCGTPDVWFLRDADDCLVGMIGVCKRKFLLNGENIYAGQCIDFLVEKRHRSLGPALQLLRCLIENMERDGYDFLYSFPRNGLKALLKRIGFVELDLFSRWAMVLRSNYIVEKYVRNKVLSSFASGILDMGLRLKRTVSLLRLPSEYSYHFRDQAGPEFDNIWQNAEQSPQVCGDRGSEYIQWRFSEYPEIDYQYFFINGEERHLGYISYYTIDRHVTITDFFSGTKSSMTALFKAFIAEMGKNGFMSLSADFAGRPQEVDILTSIGFIQRPSENCLVIYVNKETKEKIPLKRESWYFTVADRDV